MTGTRNLFKLSLYLTVGLASAMLWAAEGPFSQAALTIPIAVAAYLYVERRGTALPLAAANGLGLLAIGAALIELWVRDIEGRLLFGAHLLVYLTWILLWLPKTARQRWGLVALAVLQVSVGSVLTNSGLFGLALAGFLALCVWTLVLFQLDDAEARYAPTALPPAGTGSNRSEALLLGRGRVAAAPAASFGRWPMRQVAAAVAITVGGAVGVGAAFFLLIPRFEVARRTFDESEAALGRQRVTGFTDRVRLGEFGQILESTVPVFEVKIYDNADDTRLDVAAYARSMGYEEPLFRGLTLTTYESGEWRSSEHEESFNGMRADLRSVPRVRQEYRIQPLPFDTLFTIAPIFGAGHVLGAEDQIRARTESGTLARPRGRRSPGELSYVVYSPLTAQQINSERGRFSPWIRSIDQEESSDRYLQFPERGLEKLREIAAHVARPGGIDASPRTRADRLLVYLRDSEEFGYSLSGEIKDPTLDPVEDFLVNRKAGHCEYFASALALMLRAEGIPCRVVSGFKGGEINRLNRSFEVQQRHAHTWVEAILDDRWETNADATVDNRWETLDPTPPAARSESVAANAALVPFWSDLKSAASGFWRNYVVQMNLAQQRRTLAPIREAATAAAVALREHWWPAFKQQAYALATDPSRWISWQGGVATFVLLLFGVGCRRLGRSLSRRLARSRAARQAQARRSRRVEFYERFRRLCERRGWRPSPGETPREFAAGVARSLTGRDGRPLLPTLADLPQELTEDYYRIRFGEIDLPETTLRDLGIRLGEWETALVDDRNR